MNDLDDREPHRPPPRRRRAPALALILAAALAGPTAADYLVTRGGERIETRGPWTVKGRMVIFTDARGTLSSLRLEEVDLAASEEATRAARLPS
ncbi:MAG: hypothetical protein D6696_19500, partial [Acidobacteria bacterium]